MASTTAHVATHTHEFDLDAGIVALDFANTLDGRYDPQSKEHLREYRDLLVFSLLAGTLDQPLAGRLAVAAEGSPEPAEQQLRHAKKLREAIFGVFSAIAAGNVPRAADLDALNAFHQRAMSRGKVMYTCEGVDWDWEDDDALDRPLWPLVRSAVDLLLTGDPRRLRECAADDCGWLFYDTSRNQSRRWCSMQSCGNRAKVQQFRERKRVAS
jgi:predicted RNA-binding Zn ribbon-like protein